MTFLDTQILSGTTIKGISNILSLGLVQKHHLVTYKNQYGNEFVVHRPQGLTFKNIKAGIFYYNIIYLLKNKKNAHIMLKNSRSHPTSGVK